MTAGFAPLPTQHEYLAIVRRLIPDYTLTRDDEEWASMSRQGGIKASRFAGLLALTVSSPRTPSPPIAEKDDPPPGRMKRAGRG